MGDVAVGRRVSVDAVKAGYGKGAVVTAHDAIGLGLIDRVDTLDNTIARALTLPPTGMAAARLARTVERNAIERDLITLGL